MTPETPQCICHVRDFKPECPYANSSDRMAWALWQADIEKATVEREPQEIEDKLLKSQLDMLN